MSEGTAALAVAAISVFVGLVRETQFRRQRGKKITAETSVDEANAANTITETVKGLLIVLDARLKSTQAELEDVRQEFETARREWHEREAAMQAEIDSLKAKVSILIEAKARGEA